MAFVVLGGLLGPLVAGGLMLATFTLEQRSLERILDERLGQIVESPDLYELKPVEGFPQTYLLGFVRMGTLPRAMFELPDGVHEYEERHEAWHIALATVDGGARYAVVENTTVMEQRERISLVIIGGGTLLAVYLALWLGFRISRRLLEPLGRLAREVEAAPSGAPGPSLVHGFADDEVCTLAHALDEYRRRMEDAHRREQEFSADVSHELRNPLAVVQNAGELILADEGLGEKSRRAARRVVATAEKMNEIVSGLLLLVRETPERQGPTAPVPLAECVEAAIEACRAEMPSTSIRFERRGDPRVNAPWVAASTIAVNLIRNAVQHAGTEFVSVTLHHDRLLVVDGGAGIPLSELSCIARRGHRASTAVGRGSGVGLHLAERMCQRFGWALRFDSEPGVGTRVEWIFGNTSLHEPVTDRHGTDFTSF